MSTGNVERNPEYPSGSQATARQRIDEQGRPIIEEAQSTVGRVQEQAKDVAQRTGEQAKTRLSEQKTRAASNLSALADVLQHSGQELRDQEHSTFAGLADRAAQQITRLSDTLETKSVDELVYEAERFARRQPEVFLGIAFVAGLVAARFLKASSARRRTEMGYTDMGYSERYGAPGYGTTSYGTSSYGTTPTYGTGAGTGTGPSSTPHPRVSQYPAPEDAE